MISKVSILFLALCVAAVFSGHIEKRAQENAQELQALGMKKKYTDEIAKFDINLQYGLMAPKRDDVKLDKLRSDHEKAMAAMPNDQMAIYRKWQWKNMGGNY